MMDPLLIQKIKDATDIVAVIGEFLQLRKSGRSYVGVCPFHEDTHPSMRVDGTRQRYKCFVCGAGGDVFQFLQEHERMTFPEAVEWCANRAGIQVERDDKPEDRERIRQMESLRVVMDVAASYYQEHLQDAKAYIKKRGQNADILALYRVGYAPADGTAGRDLTAAGYDAQVLRAADITGDGKFGRYDRFRDRIMFPFMDLQGRVIGFSGRYVTPVKDAGKYINTGDTPLFVKGDNLFGLYQAKKTAVQTDTIYVVEGQFDVLSMVAAGIQNVVAGSGTAMTPKQVSLLSRFANTIVLMYDADKAGLKASISNCGQLLARGLDVRCVLLPDGHDPDEIAREQKDKMPKWVADNTRPWLDYFTRVLDVKNLKTPEDKESALITLSNLAAQIPSKSKRLFYAADLAKMFKCTIESVTSKFKSAVRALPAKPTEKLGVHGLEELADTCKDDQYCLLTPDLDEFLACDDMPALYISGRLDQAQIQELRKAHQLYQTWNKHLDIDETGHECDFVQNLADCFRAGLQTIDVVVEQNADSDGTDAAKPMTFLNAYISRYNAFFRSARPSDKTEYIKRCAQLISFAEDSVRIVNFAFYQQQLGLTKAQLTDIIKPFLEQRKTRIVLASQRADNDTDEDYDSLPQYVEDDEVYKKMYQQCRFFPKLNQDGEPVCYMFQGDKGGFQPVGDFFMTPLLHIQSDDADNNKRVIKINRRYYRQPLYIEVKSRALLKKSTIEEELILLEAVNFTNGEEKHWTRIKEWMSRNFVTCTEVQTYGNQQKDGLSRREDQMFFAFANGIYHQVDGVWRFDEVNEFGVVSHNGRNYYLPAFSNIYAGQQDTNDKYEEISTLVYKEIPADQQCSFEKWADLMNRVYAINDNGKWALLFAIMSAFRSNIHALDRLFTAPFFMGPMSSGKTQIAISIRSLFVNPKVPIFNLNIGTDAAMSSKMSAYRDVPVVLDEYNNKDISDVKFQALKGIVYDGDGRQKRKANSAREIENDKVFTPVIICGQETPQRDDNALMSRVIVCEVPKPTGPRTAEEIALFETLKDIEERGLSNVLVEILKLRPTVMDHFRELKVACYQELKARIAIQGEVDRLMKTVSLFLAMCKLILDYTDLKLPFTYGEFFDIAVRKVLMQKDLITRTDKLAVFFRAMDAMIDQKQLIEGRDFAFGTPDSLQIRTVRNETQSIIIPPGANVLFLRVGKVYTKFANSNYNPDSTTQSTIEQNLRSNPAYLGTVRGWRFSYYETVEQPRSGGLEPQEGPLGAYTTTDNTMIRRMEKRSEISYCMAFNYDIFLDTYDIDLRRRADDHPDATAEGMQDLSM